MRPVSIRRSKQVGRTARMYGEGVKRNYKGGIVQKVVTRREMSLY